MKLSQLDEAFQAAFCVNPIPPGESATCQCGQNFKSTLEVPRFKGDGPGGAELVSGCDCEYASSFGGMLWRYRHEIAIFFNCMIVAMQKDHARLVGEMPPGLDTKEVA